MTPRLAPQPWMHAPATRAVLEALEAAGGPGCARFVGGCVRDALLDRVSPPDGSALDIDLATPLEPSAVLAALGVAGLRAIPTGIDHGVVTALSQGRPFEIATLRRDVATDGRRAVVAFTRDWDEDARRRDFTMNALYADPHGLLHDPLGAGVDDALAGRVVFVGDARTRIAEDHLRSLRFFRFAAWYGHGPLDPTALEACAAMVDGLASLSGERVAKEVLKLLAAPDPRAALRAMARSGVLGALLPAADPARVDALVEIERVHALEGDAGLRLAALIPTEPAAVRAIARRLRLPNALRARLVAATGEAPGRDWSGAQLRALAYTSGPAVLRDRLRLAWAQSPEAPQWPALWEAAQTCTPPALPVTGGDLLAHGLQAGPAVGGLLRALEARWVASDFTLDRAALLQMAAVAAHPPPPTVLDPHPRSGGGGPRSGGGGECAATFPAEGGGAMARAPASTRQS